jgi:CRP-like cAMP-binding protein
MQEIQQQIITIFDSRSKLSPATREKMVSAWNKNVTLKRNDFLAKPGEVESHLFYIIKGSLRIYFPNQSEEICVGFAYDNSLICSYPSFIQQKRSQYGIQALTKTAALAIARKDFYELLHAHRDLESSWRMLEEDALLGKIEREAEMLTFTPEERYNRLLERSPHLFQIIPRKYIASYLRMTPETLSRIRPS